MSKTINDLRVDLKESIAIINDLFGKFDANKKTFLFLEWNPLYNENDTNESQFWRECINLHELFRECIPGFEFNNDEFFRILGFSESEIKDFKYFTQNLKNIRLYRCHTLFNDVGIHKRYKKNIERYLSSKLSMQVNVFDDWQFRTNSDAWTEACNSIYFIAKEQLLLIKQKLEDLHTINDNTTITKLLSEWKQWYAQWYKSENMCRLYLKSALYQYYYLEQENNGSRYGTTPQKKVNFILNNTNRSAVLKSEYDKMDEYSYFSPFELSFEIITKKIRDAERISAAK